MSLKNWIGWRELVSAGAGLALAGGIYVVLGQRIEREQDQQAFLKSEIVKLDVDISEIDKLRSVINALLARKQVVETLQRDHFGTVQLLEQLARSRPRGLYLSALREDGPFVLVTGFAASEREPSAFLSSLSGSPLLERVQLLEARADSAPRLAGYPTRFTLAMAVKGRSAAPRALPRLPTDVHPGDPK